ncbi:MBOAT family O-acyltransferase [Lonepinella sp. BR2474]|uniref:MBOAT family O-acyltransferase n=1 Tax=Lonepinella sp. BR2474 TaxID=3434548 RepID=UPI003F6DF635
MLFPTVEYALFFVFAFAVSWGLWRNNTARKVFLLVASYVFYGVWEWYYVLLLFAISLFSYFIAARIQYHPNRSVQKRWLIFGVSVCLAVLAYYKYIGFFVLNIINVANIFGQDLTINIASPILPLGISFFVFHAISLFGDTYQQKVAVQIKPLDVLLYIAFFPQLIAGPILRASAFLPQLQQSPKPQDIRATLAWMLILSGLIKKVIISNYLSSMLVDQVFESPQSYNGMDILLAIYGYAVQIYCDFSGYTNMAIGCAFLLGYKFPKNFDSPYYATNPQDFWRRWHISLSTWLRDYLYIPLGGSRASVSRTHVNLFITMVLGGLWHGASWNFVIWGCLHGIYLIIHRTWAMNTHATLTTLRQTTAWRWLSRFLLFHAVCLAWIFFRAADLDTAWQMIQGLHNIDMSILVTPAIIGLILVGLFAQYRPKRWDRTLELEVSHWHPVMIGIAIAVVIYLIELYGPTGVAPFIYFQF